jgi:hypothetical protein
VIDDLVKGFEDPVREPVLSHELPDALLSRANVENHRDREQSASPAVFFTHYPL